MKEVSLTTDYITLGQLLKLAGVAASGSDAKHIILDGNAKVNGEVTIQRGRKIRKGDKVFVEGFEEIIIV